MLCKSKALLTYIMIIGILFSAIPTIAENNDINMDETIAAASQRSDEVINSPTIENVVTYKEYSEANAFLNSTTETLFIDVVNDLKISEDTEINTDISKTGKDGVIISDSGFAQWQINVAEEALFQIEIEYMPGKKGSGNVEASMQIDGVTLFQNLNIISFKRTYQQDNNIVTNISGNDIKPKIEEVFVWQKISLHDTTGYISEPYQFALKSGLHNICIQGLQGSLAIHSITLKNCEKIITYKEYTEQNSYKNAKETTDARIEFIEGENITYKSDVTIQPVTDRVSSLTYPQSASVLKLNTIGGNSWKNPGETVTWTISVPKTGLYKIAPRFRQNISDGIFTSRKLMIDGITPFAEAENLRFNYSTDWQLITLGNNEPYWFLLEEGKHQLSLTVTIGDMSEMISQVETSLSTLNNTYRKIIMITGVSPDIYRDYNFTALMPEVINEFSKQRDLLLEVIDQINIEAGNNSSYTSIIKKIVFQLDKMYENPRSIAKYLDQYKINIGSLGTWLLAATMQPLEIDRIYFMTDNTVLPRTEADLFSQLQFSIKCFFSTFFVDYNAIGQMTNTSYKNSIKVWMQAGRDQAEILRQLIDTDFTDSRDTAVSLELVAGDTLLQSVMAGLGPDVVLDNPSSEPINYAIRNATVNLTQFKDYENVAEWFHPSSLIPYSYKGGVYALPQTYSFFMFFYRKDIFNELSLKVPVSWNDMIDLIPILQQKKLTMGFPNGLPGYSLVLYQNGGQLYKNEGEKTNLNSNIALSSFVEFTDLFTLYDLPVTYDFANRFRSGEMPCGIQDYSLYNQLSVFAPEIKGLWEMVPIPGKLDEKNQIRNTSIGNGTNVMIMSQSSKKDLSWDFVKWLMSSSTQSYFAREMESVLGSGAKYATANMEALTQMTWSKKEYTNLMAQMKFLESVPEVPGGYYLPRTISFAFNRVYNGSSEQNMAENPIEVISEYINELNDELTRKRRELGIS